MAKYYYVKGPFLVYMKRRGSEHPFLAVWVDNGELLSVPR